MPASSGFIDLILDQLSPLGAVSPRRMFGGVGFFSGGRMFALVTSEDRFYVKADDENRARFVEAGCEPFAYVMTSPSGAQRKVALPYYAPPETAHDDPEEFLSWARLGLEAANRAPAKVKPRRGKTTKRSAH
ncbi:transcriptional regulator [Agaricicola taiwanensis]|uniref:Transcriptional regulator n=1 Tax=Agaricicola taiwanensis TaxID=591372 RepID=A0A8J3DZU3_9RHOB|nr:TfoX/Sxy family protein [Agaricicola taiwanensis]GGE51958.1 transcriptional regulator [Agaricicola taiwanensis]